MTVKIHLLGVMPHSVAIGHQCHFTLNMGAARSSKMLVFYPNTT